MPKAVASSVLPPNHYEQHGVPPDAPLDPKLTSAFGLESFTPGDCQPENVKCGETLEAKRLPYRHQRDPCESCPGYFAPLVRRRRPRSYLTWPKLPQTINLLLLRISRLHLSELRESCHSQSLLRRGRLCCRPRYM